MDLWPRELRRQEFERRASEFGIAPELLIELALTRFLLPGERGAFE